MISVLDVYVKLECTGDACNVLDEMPDKDTVVWNLMIVGFARAGLLAEAMDFPSLFSVCVARVES